MKLTAHKSSVQLAELTVDSRELIPGVEFYVGRSEDCHFVIQDPKISRHHFALEVKEDGIYFKKISLMGELAHNGKASEQGKLRNGDRLSIGDFVISISDLVQEEAPAPAPQVAPKIEIKIPEPAPTPEPSLDDLAAEELAAEAPAEEAAPEESLDDTSTDGSLATDTFTEGEGFPQDNPPEEAAPAEDAFPQENFEAAPPEDSNNDGGEKTSVFSSFASYELKIVGDVAPFDRYKLDTPETFIGRDPGRCQIVLNDTETSSVHAVIRKSAINIVLEDLKSTNGTILNGERINKTELKNGDEFKVGTTTFTLEVKSEMLESESDRLMPVEDNQVIETEEIVEEEVSPEELGGFGESVPEQKGLAGMWKNPEKRKKLIIGGAILAAILIFLPSEEPPADKGTEVKKPEDVKVKEGESVIAAQKKNISKETLALIEGSYQLARTYTEQGKYNEAIVEIEKVEKIDPNYKGALQTLKTQAKNGLKRLEELNKEKQAEQERLLRNQKVKELVEKAKEAVKERQAAVAEALFNQIFEIDPENIDVPQLKLEIEAYKKAEEEKALEEARKRTARQNMVDALAPGKGEYLKGKFFKAIRLLEEFLAKKGMDEDLIKEADVMLQDAKRKLAAKVEPLLGKARSFKEGQDLKMAYDTYDEVLDFDPANDEALNEKDAIEDVLEARAKKIFREAMISESLSLFSEAKEKFQEVQQISPINSEYYKKATDKLKNYLE